MREAVTEARGRKARAARRRAEKAAMRRLEAASAPDLLYEELVDAPGATHSGTAEDEVVHASDLDRANAPRSAPTVVSPTQGASPESAQVGLVASVQRGGELSVLVGSVAGQATLSRELLQRQAAVVVGDRVLIAPGRNGRPTVVDIEPRRTRLARVREDRSRRSELAREEAVLAANVDVAVIVAAVAQPAFHPKLVDRFLVVCQYGGIQPVLCLNKCDLVESLPDVSIYEQLGVQIVHASAATGAGLDELRDLLRGNVAVFTGHSGVGKSSLANALLGDGRQVVGAVRDADGRGRHTTTWSTLLHWAEDSYVVDTPGVRALGVWKLDPATLRWYFPDLEAFGDGCRFSSCSHTHEPDCAVKEAVEAGELPRQRHESYVRMMDG